MIALLLIIAQLRIVQPMPDCDIRRPAIDQPIYAPNRDVRVPRYVWHAERIVAGVLISRALRLVHAPAVVARWAPAVIVTALHFRGAAKRVYPINPGDWAADALMMSAVAVGPLKLALAYLPLACFASP